MKRAWGNTIDRILLLLEDGPLTKAEICEELGLTHDQVASVVSSLHRKSKRFGKRIYITSYRHDMAGQKRHTRAVYGLGRKQDAIRPTPTPVHIRSLKSYHLRMARLRQSSVFSQTATKTQLFTGKGHAQLTQSL